MTNWKEYKLGELVSVNERSIGRNFEFNNIKYIDTSSVTENKFETPTYTTLSEAPSRAKRLIANGDTIISTVRPIQKHYGFIKDAEGNQVVSTGFAVVTPKIIEPRFLYYFLTQAVITEFLNTIAEGGTTTFPAFKADELKELSINLPPLPTQTAIAEILSSLDDKIELNNKINQELENLAQTLFKQWFIDFEFPNQNGEPYKSSGGEMVDSELGEIPKGWEVGNLNHIAELNKKNIKPFESAKTVFNLYSLPEFDTGKVPSQELGETILSSKYQVLKHSILVSKLNPRIPRIWTIINPNNNAICSTEFQVLKAKIDTYFPFVNSLCSSEKYISSLQSKVTGTSSSHQRVNPNDIINYEMILPSIEKVNSFYITIYDSLLLIDDNKKENLELTNLRDTLLPKLIAGELEVSEVKEG